MSTIDTSEFEERLLEERGRLQEAIERLRQDHPGSLEDETSELSLADNHLGDAASDTYDRELDEGLEEGAARRLEQIEAALRRIEDGSYGTCAVCGKQIPEERLRAAPWATLCIDDQRKQDQT
ncbi:MAG TPA: TraR/DksA C4-type zinc finger protein [Gaiellaceae bacterium]|jgi:RNA polymerase-binding protein DksA|nr:TraR/DksA C4-type zinc finger protein [Gaiellaceae bacterium]